MVDARIPRAEVSGAHCAGRAARILRQLHSYLRSKPVRRELPMKRFVLQAGAWTAFGLVAAFAVVGANSSQRRATVTPAPTATAAAVSVDACTSSDACCPEECVAPAAVAVRKATPKKVAARVARPAGVAGLVVAIDPETGDLGRPSAEQIAELEAAQTVLPIDETSHSGPVTTVRNADGSVTANLNGAYQEFATVHVGPNGKLTFGCSDAPTLPATPTAPSAPEEK
jgi:hypothetical protein